jgi:uncharacterized membrane protein
MIGCYFAAALPCFTVLTGREPFVSLGGLLFGMSMSGAVVSLAAHIGDNTRPQDFSAAFGVVTLCFGDAIMSSTRWRNLAVVFVVAGGLVGLSMQRVATAQVNTPIERPAAVAESTSQAPSAEANNSLQVR